MSVRSRAEKTARASASAFPAVPPEMEMLYTISHEIGGDVVGLPSRIVGLGGKNSSSLLVVGWSSNGQSGEDSDKYG